MRRLYLDTSHDSQEAWQRFWVLPEQRLHSLHRDVCQRLNLQLASFDPGLCKAAAQYCFHDARSS